MKIVDKKYLLFLLVSVNLAASPMTWMPLKNDGLHDPTGPAINVLQQPAEALSQLPTDTAGNKVNWVEALEEGYINPRTNIYPDAKINVLDMDYVYGETAEMPLVVFPHKPHTDWLDCANCHDKIFKRKPAVNDVNMLSILNGEFCGRCHGAVSFPLTECNRCHSLVRSKFKGKYGVQFTNKKVD